MAQETRLFKSRDFTAYELATLAELPDTYTKFSSLFLLGLKTLKKEIDAEEVKDLVKEKKVKIATKLAYLYSPTQISLNSSNNINSDSPAIESGLNQEEDINSGLSIPDKSTDSSVTKDAAEQKQAKHDAWVAKKNSVLQDSAKEAKYRKLANLKTAQQDTFWGLSKELSLRALSSSKQSIDSDDLYKKDSTSNLLKRLGKAFLYYIPIVNGFLSPIEPSFVQENFLRVNTLRLIIGRLNRVLRELEQPKSFLPMFFGWFGVVYGLRLVVDALDIFDKAILQPRSKNQQKWPLLKLWGYRFINAFLEGNRPTRMLNDVVWIGINVASIILTSGMSVIIINVAGFSMDTLIDIYRGARDLFKDFMLHRKLSKRLKELRNDLIDAKLKQRSQPNAQLDVDIKRLSQDIEAIEHLQHELKFKMLSEGLNNLRQVVMTGLILAGMVMLYFPPTSLAGIGTIVAASIVFGAGTVNSLRTLWEFGKTCVNTSKPLFSKTKTFGKRIFGKLKSHSYREISMEPAPSREQSSEASPSLQPLANVGELSPDSLNSSTIPEPSITNTPQKTSPNGISSRVSDQSTSPPEYPQIGTSSEQPLRQLGLVELGAKQSPRITAFLSSSTQITTRKRRSSIASYSVKEVLPTVQPEVLTIAKQNVAPKEAFKQMTVSSSSASFFPPRPISRRHSITPMPVSPPLPRYDDFNPGNNPLTDTRQLLTGL